MTTASIEEAVGTFFSTLNSGVIKSFLLLFDFANKRKYLSYNRKYVLTWDINQKTLDINSPFCDSMIAIHTVEFMVDNRIIDSPLQLRMGRGKIRMYSNDKLLHEVPTDCVGAIRFYNIDTLLGMNSSAGFGFLPIDRPKSKPIVQPVLFEDMYGIF